LFFYVQAHFEELDALFYGIAHPEAEAKAPESAPAAKSQENTSVTPQQTKKRPKRLTSLAEDQDDPEGEYPGPLQEEHLENIMQCSHPGAPDITANSTSTRQSVRVSNSQLLAIAEDEHNSTASLMPPPPVPATADTTISSGRPQRAAKLKTEKLLKEPSLIRKMRRPSHEETIKVKVESEQRASQINSSTSVRPAEENENEQPEPEPAVPAAAVQQKVPEEDPEDANTTKTLRVKIKREKISSEGLAPSTDASTATNVTTVSSVTTEAVRPDDTVASNTTTNTTEVVKKGRKKKKDAENHRPIKVERFSDLDKNSPVSSRTRKCSTESRPNQERSIYKDALEGPPVAEQSMAAVAPTAANETGTISNATMVLGPAPTDGSPMGPAGDATFEVHSGDKKAPLAKQDSLLTEDESLEEKLPATKLLSSIKAIKLPTRTHELFK